MFESVALVKQFTRTRTGLRVIVDILDRAYATGRKSADHPQARLNIVADSFLPKWNYIISPPASP